MARLISEAIVGSPGLLEGWEGGPDEDTLFVDPDKVGRADTLAVIHPSSHTP